MSNRGKRKEICLHEKEWELVQKKANDVKLDTTNYINQITKRVNETGSIHASEVETIQEDMECIWAAIKKSLGTL